MNKRFRKKKRVGEFKEHGFELLADLPSDTKSEGGRGDS